MRGPLSKLTLIVLSTIIGIAISEFGLRIAFPQVTMFPRYVDSSEYPIELPANTKIHHSKGNQWHFVYTTNRLGRRGEQVPMSTPPNAEALVVLGDSFTFGFGVNDDEVYTKVLAGALGSEYFVINGGMSGWGIDSEIKWYYQTGQRFSPSIVVIQFAANDPVESMTGVSAIEGGKITFHEFGNERLSWQRFLSQSRMIQKSHLYSLARNTYFKQRPRRAKSNGVPANKKSTSKLHALQSNYSELLRALATRLNSEGVALLFLSVTHRALDEKDYIYDLDKFPEIRKEVKDLESRGLLRYVELPLGEMAAIPGSPEGHQWSGGHHALVGMAIAKEVLRLRGLQEMIGNESE